MKDFDELIEDPVFMGKLEIVLFIFVLIGFIINIPYILQQREVCKKAYEECNSPLNPSEVMPKDFNGSITDRINESPSYPG